MWRISRNNSTAKIFNFTYLRRTLLNSAENAEGIAFPWMQSTKDDYKAAPFLHKMLGLFIMRKILRNVNSPFWRQEFLEGVQVAVKAVSNAIAVQDGTHLQGMMGCQLAQYFQGVLHTLSEKKSHICLDLKEIKPLNISGIKCTFGKADPSDKHILKVCGQEIVGSRRKLQSIIEESESPWNDSKYVGETAAKLGATFQVDVKFNTEERFYIESDGVLVLGSKDITCCYHLWQFECHVDWVTWDKESTDGYPISWQVSDMDQFLANNFPTDATSDTLV